MARKTQAGRNQAIMIPFDVKNRAITQQIRNELKKISKMGKSFSVLRLYSM
jgi:hypothetical protein